MQVTVGKVQDSVEELEEGKTPVGCHNFQQLEIPAGASTAQVQGLCHVPHHRPLAMVGTRSHFPLTLARSARAIEYPWPLP